MGKRMPCGSIVRSFSLGCRPSELPTTSLATEFYNRRCGVGDGCPDMKRGLSAMRHADPAMRMYRELPASTAMNYCLEMGGKHTEPAHFRLMMACAEMCRTSAHFMLIGTERP